MEKLSELEEKLTAYIGLVKPSEEQIWNDLFGFERNYQRHYKTRETQNRLNFLATWRNNIGQEVYKSKNSIGYVLVKDLEDNIFSFYNTSVSIVFTAELFEKLCKDYMIYQVKRLTEDLTERSITSNSTSKIHNLAFEWELECTQELLKFFKDLTETL